MSTINKRKNSKSPSPSRKTRSSRHTKFSDFLSKNEEKAWCERFFLKYSLVWPVLFGLWSASGTHLKFGDLGNMVASLLIASPNVIGPYLYAPNPQNKEVYETFWFKYLLWLFIFTFVATYFWSEYFFDVLGMKYNFPHLTWHFDSILLGKGKQRVPLMMMVHGWYFFITYHTCSVVFIRFVRHLLKDVIQSYNVRSTVATVLAALFFAAGEIQFTTMESIKEQFEYADMDWALSWGALLYSCYFLASFPVIQHLDEDPENEWTLQKTVESSLAASMIGFILVDLVSQYVLPEYWKTRVWYALT